MADLKDYIGFRIDPNLKKDFQKLCIDKNSDITKMLISYIKKSVKNHKMVKTK